MENFSILPVDIMLQILSRLPAEDVLECKLVSKPWKNLLQDLSFSQMHLNHLNNLDSGKFNLIFSTHGSTRAPVYCTEYDENLNCFTRTRKINLRLPFPNCYILGSCNGLICFNEIVDNYFHPVCVCNPIIREYIILPKIEAANILSGFGYCSSTNEYKVIRVCKYHRGDPDYGIFQVYTLGSGVGWRDVGKMDYDVGCWGEKGVFFDGAIHWVDRYGNIFSFHLVDEEFRKHPSPPCLPPSLLDVLGNFLCAYECHPFFGVRDSDIWVLKKKNHDVIWSKEFSNIDGKPITITKSGELLCCDDHDKNAYQNVYRYPPKASYARMLVNFGNDFTDWVCHKNTLVSLKTLGEEDTKLMDSGERERSCGEAESSGH